MTKENASKLWKMIQGAGDYLLCLYQQTSNYLTVYQYNFKAYPFRLHSNPNPTSITLIVNQG